MVHPCQLCFPYHERVFMVELYKRLNLFFGKSKLIHLVHITCFILRVVFNKQVPSRSKISFNPSFANTLYSSNQVRLVYPWLILAGAIDKLAKSLKGGGADC